MIALALFALAAAPLPGGALLGEHLPNVLENVKVGEWVTYRFDDGAGREYFWRIAVVGEQLDAKGRPAVWLELDVGHHPAMKAPIAQLKVLASRAQGLSAQGVSRMYAAFGLERAREVEPAELPRALGGDKPAAQAAAPLPGSEVRVKKGAPTRLLTPGGTVTATPVEVRLRDTALKRYWLCDAVPILHVAKIELPPIQHAMEARDWGLDAKPQMVPPEPGASTIRMEGPR